jgi:NADH-quinone oxidoreductase subunit M
MSAIALPGLASFVGEFLVLLGTFARYVVVAVIATLGIVLAAAYGLRLYQKVATGPESPHVVGMTDLRGREVTSLVPIVLLTLVLGVFPAPVLNVVNPAVDRVMDSIGMTDPEPALAPAGGEQ